MHTINYECTSVTLTRIRDEKGDIPQYAVVFSPILSGDTVVASIVNFTTNIDRDFKVGHVYNLSIEESK